MGRLQGLIFSKFCEFIIKALPLGKSFNSLGNDENLDWFRFKTFADDKMLLENIVGKVENAGYQLFSFLTMFS